MIAKKDLRLVHLSYKLLSILGFFPFSFDLKTGQALDNIPRWRHHIWKILFGSMWVIASVLSIRLVISLTDWENVVLEHLPLHVHMTFCFWSVSYWGYRLLWVNPILNIVIFNQLEKNEAGIDTTKLTKSNYTLQEHLVIGLPTSLLLNCAALYAVNYMMEPDSPLALFSLVPMHQRSLGLHVLFLVMELIPIYQLLAIHFHVLYCMPMFFQGCIEFFDSRLQVMKQGNLTLREVMKECLNCRKMQLKINLFNDLFANVVFDFKIYLLAATIMDLFLGIRLLSRAPVVSGTVIFLGLYQSALFSIIFDKAFSIPKKMHAVVTLLGVCSTALGNENEKKCVDKLLRSVPQVGIKIGSFQQLERESTPNFFNFVSEKVLGLLVTYKGF